MKWLHKFEDNYICTTSFFLFLLDGETYCWTVLQVYSLTVARLVCIVCYLVSTVSVFESKFDFDEFLKACVTCFATTEPLLIAEMQSS